MVDISSKLTVVLFSICFFCSFQISFAQENWSVSSDELNLWGIKYEKPELLEEVAGSDCFEGNALLKKMMQCGGNQLRSKDGHFIAFNMIGSTFYVNDTIPSVIIPPRIQGKNVAPYHFPELRHLRHARDDLKQLLDENASQNWRDHLNYYAPKQVKRQSNADTVISYSARLAPAHYYKGKYKNLWVLVLRKEHSLLIRSYCLYEDMSEEELAGYKAAMENVFRYDNTDRPLIDPKELEAMNLTYQQPEGFRPTYESECFQDNPRLNSMFNCRGNQLRSKDNRFIVFFPTKATIYTQEFEDKMNSLFPGGKHDLVDKQHMYQLKGEIKAAYGEEAGNHWRDYVKYSTSEQAARKFNANTVITYSVNLKPEDYYKGRYGNIWALTLQKKGKGYITLHCLYEDMPENELAKYKKAVESIFRYED